MSVSTYDEAINIIAVNLRDGFKEGGEIFPLIAAAEKEDN